MAFGQGRWLCLEVLGEIHEPWSLDLKARILEWSMGSANGFDEGLREPLFPSNGDHFKISSFSGSSDVERTYM